MNFRYAARTLVHTPGFTAIALLTLALGIGINTVVFSIYEAVVLKPIASRSAAGLVRITGSQNGRPIDTFSHTELEQIGTQAGSLAATIATSAPQTVVGTSGGHAEVLRVRLVSPNYFEALGVTPRLGRGFFSNDAAAAVVSYNFWKQKLHSDPAALSQSIRVHNAVLDIVGIAPANFAGTGLPPQMPDLWIPMAAQTEVLPGTDWLHEGAGREWQVLGLRKPGTAVRQVSAELDVLANGWPTVNNKPAHLSARPATFFQTDSGEMETFGWVCAILMVAVGMILLIGSINLVNLLFARHAAREQEFAVRLALGAGRWHLIRQLCAESLVLGIGGGVFGLIFSLWACEWIRAGIDGVLQRISGGALGVFLDLSPDWRVFAFTAAVSILAGLAIGLWPAAWASKRNLSADLKLGVTGSGAGYRKLWSKRNLLIAAQVAACLVLLAASGMLFRGVWRSGAVSPGFETRHLMLLSIDARAVAPTPAARLALLQKARDRVQALPQVASIAMADRPPFLGHGTAGFTTEGKREVDCLFNGVSERYFETVGIPLLAGRSFTRDEIERDAAVVVINDVAARQAWPGQDPLGQRVSGLDWQRVRHESATVIGVVKGVRSTYLSKADEPFLYLPIAWAGEFGMFLVRTRELPEVASHAILTDLGGIDANLPSQTQMFEMDKGPMEIQRLMAEAPALAASILGTIALLLAALGIFALVAQLVAQRTREIAIRVALGATSRDVAALVLKQTLRPVLLGGVLGMAGAVGVSALMKSMIAVPDMPDLTYGGGAFPPAIFAGAIGMLLMAIMTASFLPVRRATRIAPADALRSE
jgi:macrolide transport system ATP-binding/permease protein